MARLNPEQRRAVTTTDGPLLVLAGAGTGKTRVITVRAAYLLDQGNPAESILAVTFTNKAAREMKARIVGLVGKHAAVGLTVGTFHAFCARLLRKHGAPIGVPPGFTICDASDQLAAHKAVLRDLHVPEATIHPRQLVAEVSLLKNSLVNPEAAGESAVDDRDHLVALAYRRYGEHLRRAGVLDFDDLLLRTLDLLREHEPTARNLTDRFRYLMVDEYQDTNGPQFEIVRRLAGERRNLCVVGDDDQSIYGWRGADVKNILGFERQFPGATVIRLETNYRSKEPILAAANKVIGNNPARHGKTLRAARGEGSPVRVFGVDDEEREARNVVTDIEGRKTTSPLKDMAVLFRAAAQSRALEAALRARAIPYRLVGGPSFFDRKEVRDVLAYLKLLANPTDEVSFLRIVNCPPRGIGKSTIDKVLAYATEHGLGAAAAFENSEIPAKAKAAAAELKATLARLGEKDPGPRLVNTIRALLDAIDYRVELVRCYADEQVREQRWNAVEEVVNFAENYVRRSRGPTLTEFLERLALTATDDEKDDDQKDGDALTLMTLHAAKGLEFPHVYLVGCEEGLLPHDKSVATDQVEEERRLMYVGITRAQDNLTITFAKSRAKFGRRAERMPSRFLYELKGEAPPKTWRAAGQKAPAERPTKKANGRRRSRR